ncbi:hypothetical protein H5410_032011 [Solanum commersonii]|uniref:Uncharacterized protein n=1 Tax=Solanum commersonii TaxID=4109 RepID=A0A9J5YJY4_SOLCO|nr:hypothetical protein H5410_032011 [Solanum commersonii]
MSKQSLHLSGHQCPVHQSGLGSQCSESPQKEHFLSNLKNIPIRLRLRLGINFLLKSNLISSGSRRHIWYIWDLHHPENHGHVGRLQLIHITPQHINSGLHSHHLLAGPLATLTQRYPSHKGINGSAQWCHSIN